MIIWAGRDSNPRPLVDSDEPIKVCASVRLIRLALHQTELPAHNNLIISVF